MKEIIERGATSVILHLFLPGASSTSGSGKAGLNSTSPGLAISVIRPGDSAPITYRADLGTIEPIIGIGSYSAPSAGKCRFHEIDSSNLPGWYELQLADVWFADVAGRRSVGGMIFGAADIVPTPFQVQLSDPLRGVGSPAWLDAPVSSRPASSDWTPTRAARLDLIDTAVSSRGDALASNQQTILSRLGGFTGVGNNTLLGYLRAALLKDPGFTPDSLGGTFDNQTDSLEALADRVISVVLGPGERVAVADAILDRSDGVESGETVRQFLRLLRAVCLGQSTGFPAGPVQFRDRANNKPRVTATVDAAGNRLQITTDSQ